MELFVFVSSNENGEDVSVCTDAETAVRAMIGCFNAYSEDAEEESQRIESDFPIPELRTEGEWLDIADQLSTLINQGEICEHGDVLTVRVQEVQPQTSLFSYSTNGAYRGTLQIVAENLACANTALVHFLDEEEMGQAHPPMSADDWKLNFVVPVGGDIQRIDGDVTIAQGESVVLDYDWIVN